MNHIADQDGFWNTDTWDRVRWMCVVMFLIVLCCAVYGPTLRHEFVWDDHEQVVDNELLRDWGNLSVLWTDDVLTLSRASGDRSNYYRPLFFTQLLVYHQVFGLDTRGWHAMAILQHIAATLAILAFLICLGVPVRVAALTTAFFAVHPVHGESVSWVAAAFNDPPASTLILIGLAIHTAWSRNRRWSGLLGGAVAFAGALLLKEGAIAMLLLVPLTDWYVGPALSLRRRLAVLAIPYMTLAAYPLADRHLSLVGRHPKTAVLLAALTLLVVIVGTVRLAGSRRDSAQIAAVIGVAPYLLVTMGYFFVRKICIHTMLGVFGDGSSLFGLLPTVPKLALAYLGFLVWPFGLSPAYPLRAAQGWGEPAVVVAAIVCILVVVVIARFAASNRLVLFAALWFVFTIWPVFDIRGFRPTYLVHQRYLYLSCLSICLILGWLLVTRGPRPRARFGLAFVLMAILAGSTVYHNRFWARDSVLWQRVASVDPANPAPFDWLGARALEEGRVDEAEKLFAQAIRADPRSPFGYRNMAILIHTRRHRPAEAISFYETAMVHFRDGLPRHEELYTDCRVNRAVCFALTGRTDEALDDLVALATKPPYSAMAARNAAVLLQRQGRIDAAASILEESLFHHPDDPEITSMRHDLHRLQNRRE